MMWLRPSAHTAKADTAVSGGQISRRSRRATDIFRFRCIPDAEVTTDHLIYTGGEKFDITSVEDVKGRGMYIEVPAKRWWRLMAKAEIKLPEELLTRLSHLGKRSDEIAEKMLEAGGIYSEKM